MESNIYDFKYPWVILPVSHIAKTISGVLVSKNEKTSLYQDTSFYALDLQEKVGIFPKLVKQCSFDTA